MEYTTTFFHLICFLSFYSGGSTQEITVTETRPVNFTIKLTEDYNKKAPPAKHNEPAVVKVDITPWKIGEISVERMVFEVDLYMTVLWQDHRLTFEGNEGYPHWRRIVINQTEADNIWKPVLNFRNVMGSKALTFEPNFIPVRLSVDTLFYVLRKVEKFHCHFDLKNYPLDTQKCAVELQALNYKTVVVLHDNTSAHELRSHTDPPQFQITHHSSGNCTRKDGASRYYSCIQYGFVLRRQVAHHLMLTYAPSFLIVLLSWISFWLDVQATPARVALGLTSLLTLATQFSNAQKNLPPVAYIKALDIWMFTCIFMVFGSIAEFALANYTARFWKAKEIEASSDGLKTDKRKLCSNFSPDVVSRYAFPIVFFIFNMCYWIYYGNQ